MKTKVAGAEVKRAREAAGIGQRELARRVADRMGLPEKVGAFNVRLNRIEQRDASKHDREFVEALAQELQLGGPDDLGTPPLWVWAKRSPAGEVLFEAFAEQMPTYSSPEVAYDARDALAHKFGLTPFENAHLVPVSPAAIDTTLEWNFGEDVGRGGKRFLAPVDVTDPDELKLMVATDGAIASADLTLGGTSIREMLVESAIYSVSDYAHLVQLHGLVLERLRNARPEISPVQLAEWRAREAALAEILEAVVEGRRKERERVLSGDTSPPTPPWEKP